MEQYSSSVRLGFSNVFISLAAAGTDTQIKETDLTPFFDHRQTRYIYLDVMPSLCSVRQLRQWHISDNVVRTDGL